MKRKIMLIMAVLFVGITAVGTHDLYQNQYKLEVTEIELQDTLIETKQLRLEKEKLNKKFDELINENDVNTERLEQLEKEKLELEERARELERKLQAKAEAKEAERIASLTPRVEAAPAVTGNKESWLRASGIPQAEWWAVDYIVSRESGWNPCAYNPGRSDCNANPTSACGLAQSLPCGKQAKYGHWTDPVANLKWQHEYVKNRYGGYPQAVAFWRVNHWY